MRSKNGRVLLIVMCLVALSAGNLVARSGKDFGAGQPVWKGGCGDGVIAPGEECDPGIPGVFDPNLGGKTCESEGYGGGELSCTAAGAGGAGCKLDRSGCSCPPSVPAGPPAPVPKTGQTGCWDDQGAPINCAGTGQDGEYQAGGSVEPRFTDNGDGTVTDNLTWLIWLKDGSCFGIRSWTEALTDANTLSDGDCGLTDGSVAGDWRLPNIRELQSLIDFNHVNPAFPTPHPFSNVGPGSGSYWSSTTYLYYPFLAWRVSFSYGGMNVDRKNDPRQVWPVRGGR